MLVALAAIFLPMILDGSGREGHVRIDMDIPPEPVFPAPERLPPLPTVSEPTGRTAPAEPEVEAPAEPPAEPEVEAPAEPPAEPTRPPRQEAVIRAVPEASAPAETPAEVTAGWAVQVGSFSQQERARALRDKLKDAGFAAFIEPFDAGNGTVYRVKVGPEAERADAEKLGERLEKEQGLKVLVVSQS